MEATKGVDVSRADEYTVATWLRSWYDIYAKPNVRVATADRYRLMIEQYAIPRIGSIKLTKLMESGRTNRKRGHGNPGLSTTVRSLHLMLHNALNRAVKERLILRNPTEDCIAPKVQKFEMQILQPEHIKTYLDTAEKRGLLPMFYLELVSGLRKGALTLSRPKQRHRFAMYPSRRKPLTCWSPSIRNTPITLTCSPHPSREI